MVDESTQQGRSLRNTDYELVCSVCGVVQEEECQHSLLKNYCLIRRKDYKWERFKTRIGFRKPYFNLDLIVNLSLLICALLWIGRGLYKLKILFFG